jgi:hypothetical protein
MIDGVTLHPESEPLRRPQPKEDGGSGLFSFSFFALRTSFSPAREKGNAEENDYKFMPVLAA